jgi:branched-subunit amino acid transport protein
MSIWVIIIVAGLLTFATRLSFIALFGRMNVPAWVQRALRFVPPAVLTAIIFPELFISGDTLNLSPANPRLIAGLLAALVAWRTKNIVYTILVGMAALLAMQALL